MSYFSIGFSSQRQWGVQQPSPNTYETKPSALTAYYSGSVTTSVTFIATAAVSSTRTASVTAIVTFTATSTGFNQWQGAVTTPGQQPAQTTNFAGINQGLTFSQF